MKTTRLIAVCLILATITSTTLAQQDQTTGLTGQTKNYISTGMPILLVAPTLSPAAWVT